jgi:hypothetical protein
MNQKVIKINVGEKEDLEKLNKELKHYKIISSVFCPRSDYNRPMIYYTLQSKSLTQ